MLSKNELKYIQSLCQKKQRQAEGLFLAEGAKLVDELLHSDYRIRSIYAVEEWVQAHPAVQATVVTQPELERMSNLQTPNQVLAIAEQQSPASEPGLKDKLTILLDGIQDPGNLGTIIRIADWFGINQIVASNDTVELYNPKVIQSSMGSFLRVKLWYKDAGSWIQTCSVPIYGALLKGTSLYQVPPVKEGLLVIGNESKGIREDLMPYISAPVTIPRSGGAESLNAAVATGIILSHILKS
jgi:TrmH family RNA methyltransferase